MPSHRLCHSAWCLTDNSTISIPFPTHRLASSALRALSVDAEISPLVRRTFSLSILDSESIASQNGSTDAKAPSLRHAPSSSVHESVDETCTEKAFTLETEYRATTNRMLRVAVNGFMESVGVILGIMEELDVDVLAEGCDLGGGNH